MSEKHCETCICGKRAPVQGTGMYLRLTDPKARGAGTVTWAEHLEAHGKYAILHRQGAERIAERGGFEYWEITELLGYEPKTWEPRR